MSNKKALKFTCDSAELIGILDYPDSQNAKGVVIVVGGPQYRIGSHRQFVLMSRYLAMHGIPTFRFDYRGMGDSEGEQLDFELIEKDIEAAISAFINECPYVEDVILWGLCDAATALSYYAHNDPRIAGLVMLNPWVRTTEGQSKSFIKHYYMSKLLSKSFWKDFARGRVRIIDSTLSFLKNLAITILSYLKFKKTNSRKLTLPEKMLSGLNRFNGKVLFVLSGDDLTAAEFVDTVNSTSEWETVLENDNYEWNELPEANHTFSTEEWRGDVEAMTLKWLQSW